MAQRRVPSFLRALRSFAAKNPAFWRRVFKLTQSWRDYYRTLSMRRETNPANSAVTNLNDLVQLLSTARNLTTVMDIVRHGARRLTRADGASFVLKDGDQCYYAEEDAISPLWKGQRFPMEKCVSGWSMMKHASLFIEDIYTDPRVLWEAYHPTFIKSLAMAPIRRESPVGAVGIYWAQRHAASKTEMQTLEEIAAATGVAMAAIADGPVIS